MITVRLLPRHLAASLAALALLTAACGQTTPEAGSAPSPPPQPRPAPAEAVPLPAASAEPEDRGAEVDDPAEEAEATEPEPDPAATGGQTPDRAAEAREEDDQDPATAATPAPEEEAPPPPPQRAVVDNAWTPFAAVGGVTLHHPSARVERVGFHQANHDGARQLEVLADAIAPLTLEGRGRATGSRSAADVVVDPEVEIRAPVSGTVVRAGTYVLYCDHSDDYAVIDPDGHPGWEVKVLHIDGVRVAQGQRVEAGRTVLAPRPTPLPFESQVDEHTAEPSWPHVHIEVVDPSIPNEGSGGSC